MTRNKFMSTHDGKRSAESQELFSLLNIYTPNDFDQPELDDYNDALKVCFSNFDRKADFVTAWTTGIGTIKKYDESYQSPEPPEGYADPETETKPRDENGDEYTY